MTQHTPLEAELLDALKFYADAGTYIRQENLRKPISGDFMAPVELDLGEIARVAIAKATGN